MQGYATAVARSMLAREPNNCMRLPDNYEVIESIAIVKDPATTGFSGVLFELIFDGEGYVLTATALGSGNRLLKVHSGDARLTHAILERSLVNSQPEDGGIG